MHDLSSNSKRFEEFILEAGLIDVGLVGRKFTWSRLDRRCCNRIDCALVSVELCDGWGSCKLWGLPKGESDYCPIFLHDCDQNWGPKSFRFFNMWLKHPEFESFVEENWAGYWCQGWGDFVFKEKLKLLKVDIKAWISEKFGDLERKSLRQVLCSMTWTEVRKFEICLLRNASK